MQDHFSKCSLKHIRPTQCCLSKTGVASDKILEEKKYFKAKNIKKHATNTS